MWGVPAVSVRTALVAGVVLFALVGCGGNERSDSASRSPESSAGAKVFADAGCGGCHTLQSAKTTGTVGPNLDDVQPDKEKVVRQVTNGGVGMPSFRDTLSK